VRTDELIETLGPTVERVESRSFRNAFIIALIIGAALAVCLMQAVLGTSASALRESHLGPMVLIGVFVLGVIAAGSSYLLKAAHPGMAVRAPATLLALLVGGFVCAGVAALLAAQPAARSTIIFGPPWTICLMCIPLFAIGPFVALVFAIRQGAATRLREAGAVAGLVAGAVGAGACALHQPSDSLAFTGLWYTGPTLICAVLGALLGPRVLRW
jgi:hypothetical protein